jgi:hypothetical protein
MFGIFLGLFARFSFWLPVLTRRGDGLIGARFILCPDRQSLVRGQRVCLLEQGFFPAASGSVTRDRPTFAHADGLAGGAAGAILLPGVASSMQDS